MDADRHGPHGTAVPTSTPPPASSSAPAPGTPIDELAKQWQQLGVALTQWWQRALLPLAPAQTRPAVHADAIAPLIPPERFVAITAAYQARAADLIHAIANAPAGTAVPMLVPVPDGDRRFRHPAWRTSPFHALMLQAWLLQSSCLEELAASAVLPAAEHERLRFMTRQAIEALAPTNFAATNPEVVERALSSKGGSLVQGARNLAADIGRGAISMSAPGAFVVGGNLATTPGSVVYQNELIELIQYAPATRNVHARPLVIIPPCINKFYILDLSPGNSFVRHAVAQGHTTFMLSWRNVPRELGHLDWDAYLELGVLQALQAARAITGSSKVNTLGFCVGGTLLACALSVLAARKDATVSSATFLATMLDYAEPGDIGVYVSRENLALNEPALLAGRRMHGRDLACAFASLRPNELVWNYVVHNYLLGETPPAFDILHWNADGSNLPGPMYAYYLRELYIANRLREPDALTMAGESIDLSRIRMPAYVLATRGDHIVPWTSAYRTTQLLGGDVTFTLGASGHIAGILNPPADRRRNHWVNDAASPSPDAWLASARTVDGSWWGHWSTWLDAHAGRTRVAPTRLGSAKHPPVRDAPGRYVVEAVD